MISIEKHGTISRCATSVFGYHAWGTIAKLQDGTLAAACSAGRVWHVCPFGKNMLFLSRDEGETWSAPVVVNDTWLDDRDVGLTALPNGGLLMTWFNSDFTLLDVREKALREIYTEGEWKLVCAYRESCGCDPSEKRGSHIRVSYDGGMTWGETYPSPVSAPHGPVVMLDGALLYFGKTEHGQHSIAAYRSADDGKTWTELGRPGLPPYTDWSNFFEPHAIQLPSGRIVGIIRYEKTPENHLEEYGNLSMFITFSDDGGVTWTVPKHLGVSGSPPHLMLHSSGALICSYGRRDVEDLSERALISWDGGETWPEDVAIARNAPDWDLGYPSTVELSDGSLLTAYYEKYVEDGRPDRKASFLYTKWRLNPPTEL